MPTDGPLVLPVFPAELERIIFETVAHMRPVSIPRLMRVANRVKIWLEPILYRTLSLCEDIKHIPPGYLPFRSDSVLDLIRSNQFPGKAVRHLLLQTEGDRPLLLSSCPSVEYLWINPDLGPDVFPAIEGMPLKRLYCNLTALFGPDRPLDFTHRMFSLLTHLEISISLWHDDEPSALENLVLIPNLTHLAFRDPIFKDLWLPLLRGCPLLRVLLVLDCDLRYELNGELEPAVLADPRFVEMHIGWTRYTTEWIIGAHTDIDYWSRAEEFVEKRRLGEVDVLHYWINRPENFEPLGAYL
ncbi:hypothetical protein C8R46DRAFT_1078197 [Mycena filopes]|nr:hypothetical protein C8R46DRAFT_1078197 [Mycena filopes]